MFSLSVRTIEELVELQDEVDIVASNGGGAGSSNRRKKQQSNIDDNSGHPISAWNKNIIISCSNHLDVVDKQLTALEMNITSQAMLLKLVVHEPDLWYRAFPTNAYEKLLHSFERILRSGQAVSSGARTFCAVMSQMIERGEIISYQLHHYRFMTQQLFVVSMQAEKALRLAYAALQR